MRINWELETTKKLLESKGYTHITTLGSINYTCYVYQGASNGKRIEIWDDKSGELHVVDVNNKSVDLTKL